MNEARNFEYKYLIKTSEGTEIWEDIPNRKIDLSCYFDYKMTNIVTINDTAFGSDLPPSTDLVFGSDIEATFKHEHFDILRQGKEEAAPGLDLHFGHLHSASFNQFLEE